MAIGIVQIGLNRFYNTTLSNHLELYELLDKRYGTKIYNFYRDAPNPQCPFDLSGKVQVYDFLTAKDQVSEDIIFKIRSDIYFTKSSMDVICKEIDCILENNNDIAFLGIDFMNDFDKEHKRENVRDVVKTTDFAIIARRESLEDTEKIINLMRTGVKDKSGNKTFYLVLKPETRGVKISCQIYIVRKDYESYDNWQIYWDWCSEYKKSEQAQNWVKNNARLIRSF